MKNKPEKMIVISLAMLLILSLFSSIGISTENVGEENSESNITRIISSSKPITLSAISNDFGGITTLEDSNFSDLGNIVVANSTGDESYPSMILRGSDGLVAYEYEDSGSPYLYLRQSDNYGQNWSESYKLLVKIDETEISVNSPVLCRRPSSKTAYGTFLSNYNNSGLLSVFDIYDISEDLEDIESGNIWDWSNVYQSGNYIGSWWGFKDLDIVYHAKHNQDDCIVDHHRGVAGAGRTPPADF